MDPLFDVNKDFSQMQEKLLSAGIHFFHRHIRNDDEVERRMTGNSSFRLFCETQYHGKPDLNKIFADSVRDSSPMHVCSFILSILHQGIFSVAAFIVSVIYLSRFKEASQITLHACTWRPLFLTTLLVADKMWEDKPVRNSSLAKLFPVLSNIDLNTLEHNLLTEVRFNVIVKQDLFCSFCEKLLAERVNPEIVASVKTSDYAAALNQESTVNTNYCQPTYTDHDVNFYPSHVDTNGHDETAAHSNHDVRRNELRHFSADSRGITAAISIFGCQPISLNRNTPFFQHGLLRTNRLSEGDKRPRSTDTRQDPTRLGNAVEPPRSHSMDPTAKGQSIQQVRQQLRNTGQEDAAPRNPARSFFTPKIGLLGPPLRRSLPATAKPGQYMAKPQSPIKEGNNPPDAEVRPEHRPSVRGQRTAHGSTSGRDGSEQDHDEKGNSTVANGTPLQPCQVPFQALNPQLAHVATQRPQLGVALQHMMNAAPAIRSSSLPRYQAQPLSPTRTGTATPLNPAQKAQPQAVAQKVPTQRASSAPRTSTASIAPRTSASIAPRTSASNATVPQAGVGQPRLHTQPLLIGMSPVRGSSSSPPNPHTPNAGISAIGLQMHRAGSPIMLNSPTLLQGPMLSATSRGRSPGPSTVWPSTGSPQARIPSPSLLSTNLRGNMRGYGIGH